MISILRNIRKSLIGSNSAQKYFLYAIGEIALVVIGILIALQINNWNQERQAHLFEDKLLKELQQAIKSDYFRINNTIRGNESAQNSCRELLNHMDNNYPYHDSLDFHFGYSLTWWKFDHRKSAFDNAKAYGLQFIKDDTTKTLLTNLYETSLLFMKTQDERQTQYHYTTIVPVLTELFETSNFVVFKNNKGHKPLDYELLKKHKIYRNILKSNVENRENENIWLRSFLLTRMQELERRLQNEIDSN